MKRTTLYGYMMLILISTLMLLNAVLIGVVNAENLNPNSSPLEASEASDCATCHGGIVKLWSDSYHAKAGIECQGCHFKLEGPQHPLSSYANISCKACHFNSQLAGTKMAENGVDCRSCHNPHSLSPYSLQLSVECGRCHVQLRQADILDPYCRSCHMLGGSSREGDDFSSWKRPRHDFSASLNETCLRCHSSVPLMDMAILKLQKEALLLEAEGALNHVKPAVEAIDNSTEAGLKAREYLNHAENLLSMVSRGEEDDLHRWLIDHTLLSACIKLTEKAKSTADSSRPPAPIRSELPLATILAVGVSLAVVIPYSLRNFGNGRGRSEPRGGETHEDRP